MEMTLPKGLEEFVKAQIASGLYESEEEVRREGLRLLKQHKEGEALKHERLRQDLSLGLQQLDRGEGRPFDVNDIVALGKARQGR